ncbi:MAG TPA: hypothetical protein VIY52_26690 [Streptosporangiaceae bacterium]
MNYLRACGCALAALVLAGCATASAEPTAPTGHPATGHLTGRFLMEGGPISPGGQQPGERPISGTVILTAAGHRSVTVEVGPSGSFSKQLPPGNYQMSGRSPDIETGSGSGKPQALPCSQPTSVTITAGHTARVDVVCYVP